MESTSRKVRGNDTKKKKKHVKLCLRRTRIIIIVDLERMKLYFAF